MTRSRVNFIIKWRDCPHIFLSHCKKTVKAKISDLDLTLDVEIKNDTFYLMENLSYPFHTVLKKSNINIYSHFSISRTDVITSVP